jgi:uncharacterized membrane protein YesL
MIGFMIKKAFFDFWDNLFRIILLNLGFILLLGIPVFLPYWVYPLHVALSVVSFAAGIFLLFVYAGAASLFVRDISDYSSPGFAEFYGYVKESWPAGIGFGIIVIAHIALLMVAFPVYSSMKNIFGLAAMVFIFWMSVLWIFASLYFFPVRARLDKNILKILKKCFLLFFDNTAFTLFLAFGMTLIVAVSTFTAFLLPGPAAALLWLQVAFKLRLMKYDYLEAHPEAERKKIPWEILLLDEEERVGKRTLKGMIFPWKD